MAPVWLVYIIQSANGRLYTGITTDIKRRLRQHNGELVGGARYTRAGRPWIVVYTEEFKGQGEALKREAAIKKFSRARKLKLARLLQNVAKRKMVAARYQEVQNYRQVGREFGISDVMVKKYCENLCGVRSR